MSGTDDDLVERWDVSPFTPRKGHCFCIFWHNAGCPNSDDGTLTQEDVDASRAKLDAALAKVRGGEVSAHVINWPDLMMSVELHPDTHHCHWRIVHYAEVTRSDRTSRIEYLTDGGDYGSLVDADTVADGFTKWDGCVDFASGDNANDHCMIHACGAKSPDEVLEAIRRANAAAFKMIPHRDEELGK